MRLRLSSSRHSRSLSKAPVYPAGGCVLGPGSVLIYPFHPPTAAFNVLRTQSETLCLFVLALASIAFSSAGVRRTRSIPSLARPFGRGGLPAFLRFGLSFTFPKLLNCCGTRRRDRRGYLVRMQDRCVLLANESARFTELQIVRGETLRAPVHWQGATPPTRTLGRMIVSR